MKLSKSAVLLAAGISLVGAGLLVACGGDDDDGGSTATKDAGSTANTGSQTPADTGTGTSTDSGAVDAGTDAGDPKALGESCATNTECASNACFVGGSGGGGGGGGGATAGYCTLVCTMGNANDPVCTAHVPPFSGKCNTKLFCQKQ